MEREIIVYREGLVQSVIADTYTFGIMFGMLYANHRWFGDHAVVALAFVLILGIFAVAKQWNKQRTFHSTEAAITHLKRLNPHENN